MEREETTPFVTHVFVCTNDRQGARKSCADGDSLALRATLKQAVEDRGWRGRVRISASGCLGICEKGPNVMLYPQGRWFSACSPTDADALLGEIEGLLEE